MLYIDTLCRGYHPVKGFQPQARNVFKTDISSSKSFTKFAISHNEAIGTIWRCLAREIGRPLKNYNMKCVESELIKEMKKIKECSTFTDSQKTQFEEQNGCQEYEKKRKKLCNLQGQIVRKFQQIAQKGRNEEQRKKRTKANIANLIGKQILNLEHKIFIKTIIGIRQHQQNTTLVQLVMEQPYPYISMPRQKAIEMLTLNAFNEKWNKYKEYEQNFELCSEILIVCHRCLTPLNGYGRLIGCNDSQATFHVGHTLLTNPYMYSKQVINENCWDQDTHKYIHPYLIYYSLESQKLPICSRYFCNKCEGFELSFASTGICSFCEGVCDCTRCQGMDFLTKMMAVYIDNGGNLAELMKKFWMKFDIGKLDPKHKKFIKSRAERQADMRECLQNLFEKRMLIRIKDLPEDQAFEKTLYFSENVDRQEIDMLTRYKVSRQSIQESLIQKKQRKIKLQKQNVQIQRINDIISKRTERTEMENEDSEAKKQKYHQKMIHGEQQNIFRNGTSKTRRDESSADQKQRPNLYYEDSDS